MTSAADDFIVRPYRDDDRASLLELMRRVWSHKHRVEAHVHDRWWSQWDHPPLYLAFGPAGARRHAADLTRQATSYASPRRVTREALRAILAAAVEGRAPRRDPSAQPA